jgi:hypothetical protein
VSLIGSTNSYYALIGQPSLTSGTIRRANASVGPLMQTAWCKGVDREGNDNTYMFTTDGLYVIPAGDYLRPQRLSREKLPNELVGVNVAAGDKVAIGYDQRWPGIHVAVNPFSGSDVNYFYDLQTGGWFPTAYSITPQLMPTMPKLMAAGKSSMLMISSGGVVNQFDSDSIEVFDSYMWLGPIKLSDEGGQGILISLAAALAKDSENVNWQIFVGESAEEAFNSSAAFTGRAWSYTSGRYWNYTQHPRRRGNVAYLKVYDVSDERWLIEEIVAEIQQAGRRRVG